MESRGLRNPLVKDITLSVENNCPVARAKSFVNDNGKTIVNAFASEDVKYNHPPLISEHFLTRFPKHPKLHACQKCKMQRSPHRKKEQVAADQFPVHDERQEIGDVITADHKVMFNKAFTSFDNDCVRLIVQDKATLFPVIYPAENEHSVRTVQGSNFLSVPTDNVKFVYSANSSEVDFWCNTFSPAT